MILCHECWNIPLNLFYVSCWDDVTTVLRIILFKKKDCKAEKRLIWLILFSLQVGCKVLQFFHMYMLGCNYFWMLCEGIYLHTLIVVAVFAEEQHLHWYYLLGWGESFLPRPVLFLCCSVSVKTYSCSLKNPREAVQQDWVESNNFLVTEVILISSVRSFSLRASFVRFLFRQCSPLNVCTQFNSLLNSNACKHFHPCTRVSFVHLLLDLQSCSCIFMYELITLRWWWWGFQKGDSSPYAVPQLFVLTFPTYIYCPFKS